MTETRDRVVTARGWKLWVGAVVALGLLASTSDAAESKAVARFQDEIQPILIDYCYRCHADGMKKGEVAFDQGGSDEALVKRRELWWAVLKNVRAGIMPPAGKPRPTDKEIAVLADWIKHDVFGIDPKDPDPGRVTIRRLNRVEYRNTIRDLMGIDFKAEEEFPPDDTGYGFDNIGDVLSVSPLLLEKYFQAAESIVKAAVPTASKTTPERSYRGVEFRGAEKGQNGDRLAFSKPAKVSRSLYAEAAGDFRFLLELAVQGPYKLDPGRCTVVFKVDDREKRRETYTGLASKTFRYTIDEHLSAGDHKLTFELTPGEPRAGEVNFRIVSVRVQGPLDAAHRVKPPGYGRFFPRDEAPASDPDRRRYAREVLGRFAGRAFRRPVDARTLDRLVAIAESVYRLPGKTFEEGVAQAMVAVLASPRFLFRVENAVPGQSGRPHAPIDEYALASRLSYFLWSTMPDDELFALAEQGQLRAELPRQVSADAGRSARQGADAELRRPVARGARPRGDLLQRAGHPPPRRGPAAGGRHRAQRPDPRRPPGHAARDRDGLRVRRPRGPQHPRVDRQRLHVPERQAGQALRHTGRRGQRDPQGHAAQGQPARRRADARDRSWR